MRHTIKQTSLLEAQPAIFPRPKQIRSAIALLRDAILADGIARIDHLLDEEEFFIDGAGI
jgi:hypothetical protein